MMQDTKPISIDSLEIRHGGREVLSLALMDARNHTLHLITQLETALGDLANRSGQWVDSSLPAKAGLNPPLWTLGHTGWFQEWWIGRNLQRDLGTGCEPQVLRLASIEPRADFWWNPAQTQAQNRWALESPDAVATRGYLLDTLEATLELLEKAPQDDRSLYFYRLALCHEDMQGEALIVLAQTCGAPLQLPMPGPVATREPVLVPAVRWRLGRDDSEGFAFDNECPAYEVAVPQFEIDAQPVTWAQFVEFVDDGGYDRQEIWHPDGWKWLVDRAADEGRRGPRYVDQIGVASGAVMQTRFGRPMRMLGSQPATHVTWWEADAWCRWAGRRLPAEVEWEVAAHTSARRGFRWGDVWEWTGTTLRGYPGFKVGPWQAYCEPAFGTHKVLRGASFATRARMKSPKFRQFSLPERDEMFCGFRSCEL